MRKRPAHPAIAAKERSDGAAANALAVSEVHEQNTAGGPVRALKRPYFELDRSADPDAGTVSFSRPLGVYVELLARHELAIERIVEPRPPAGAITSYADYASSEWARDFPAELIIRARRG